MTTATTPTMFQGLPRRQGIGGAFRLALVALVAGAFVLDLEQPPRPTAVLETAVVSLSRDEVQARRGPAVRDTRLASLTAPVRAGGPAAAQGCAGQ
jgi:hypothetical protein